MSIHSKLKYADVAVDCFTPQTQLFTYYIPNNITVSRGDLVKVEFKNRNLFGVIFELKSKHQIPKTNLHQIKNILQVVEGFPKLTLKQLKLSKWISEYYHSSIFKAAQLMFPANQNINHQKLYFAPQNFSAKFNSDLEKTIFKQIFNTPGITQKNIENKYGKSARNILENLIKKELILMKEKFAPLNNQKKITLIKFSKEFQPQKRSEYLRKNSHKQKNLLEYMVNSPGVKTYTSLSKHFGYSALNSLIKKNILTKYSTTLSKKIINTKYPEDIIKLKENEKNISKIINSSIKSNAENKKIFLLKYNLPSSKIQIYIEAIRNCINKEKSVLVLAPEISIANELFKQINEYFPKETVLFHSNISQTKRNYLWWEIRQGLHKIIIGTQNSIFIPLHLIGLIILDDEHEDSYKNIDSNPKFDTRKIAEKLSESNNFTLVLSSSTPSIESFLKSNFKKYTLLDAKSNNKKEQKNRYHLIDLNEELKEGNRSPISKELLKNITSCINNKTQGMLFLNQRGSYSHIFCEKCRFILTCNKCNTTINYHNDVKILLCHYCGKKQKPTSICPNCSNKSLLYRGLGTKQLCEIIQSKFPKTKILRLDKDSISNQKQKIKILESFQNGNAQFLIGTDMISKGFVFPNVTLIGMIIGETGLQSSNFRSAEKIFQRIYNLSKIASESKIIIQTYRPNFYPILTGTSQNYPDFFQKEIIFRKTQNLPPYSKIIKLTYSNKNEQLSLNEANKTFTELINIKNILNIKNIEINQPTPAYPAKYQDLYKFQIYIRGKTPHLILQNIKLKQNCVVEVDPI